MSKNNGEEGGDSDALGQMVGCAAGATAGALKAGSPDVADVPPVPEQVVYADRWGSAVFWLPQPAMNTPHEEAQKKI